MAVIKGVAEQGIEVNRPRPFGHDLSKITTRQERFEFHKGVTDAGVKYGQVALKADDTFESPNLLEVPANSVLQFMTVIKGGKTGSRLIVEMRDQVATGAITGKWGDWSALLEESAPGLTRFDINQNLAPFFMSDNKNRQFRLKLKAAVSEDTNTANEGSFFIFFLQFGNI